MVRSFEQKKKNETRRKHGMQGDMAWGGCLFEKAFPLCLTYSHCTRNTPRRTKEGHMPHEMEEN